MRRLNRRRPIVLAYHNVIPDDARPFGDRSLHLRRADFVRQMELVSRTHDIVPLNDILSEPRSTRRPQAAITFDDAYRGSLTLGLAEMVRLGLPFTCFVAPGLLGAGACWWDAYADAGGRGLDADLRAVALDELAGDSTLIGRHAAREHIKRAQIPHYGMPVTMEELSTAARCPLLTLGSHTWTHRNLNRLNPPDLEAELERPKEWLAAEFPCTIKWLAYPYGLHSPGVHKAVRSAGYDAALTLEPQRLTSAAARQSTPRLNVPAGLSHNGFIAGISGVRLSRS
jgi:peptidoglycan/xylan/chitin deacetylase (PgdA/CDA1 family)